MQTDPSAATAKRRTFFADLFGGIADLIAPLWRGWWDKRYYRSMRVQNSVAVFSFLVVFVALGWYARAPLLRAEINREFLQHLWIGKAPQSDSENLSLALYLSKRKDGKAAANAGTQNETVLATFQLQDKEGNNPLQKDDSLFKDNARQRVNPLLLEKLGLAPSLNKAVAKILNQQYVSQVIAELIIRVCEAVVLGALLWIAIRKRTANPVGFTAGIRLAIVAMAPGLLANLITDLTGLTALTAGWPLLLSLNQLPFWILTVFYLCFAARAMRTEPAV